MHERLDKVAKLVFAVSQALRRRYAFKKVYGPSIYCKKRDISKTPHPRMLDICVLEADSSSWLGH